MIGHRTLMEWEWLEQLAEDNDCDIEDILDEEDPRMAEWIDGE